MGLTRSREPAKLASSDTALDTWCNRDLIAVRAAADAHEWQRDWDDGRSLSLPQIVALALEE